MTKSELAQLIELTIDSSCGVDPDTAEILYPNNKYLAFRIIKVLEENGYLDAST
jgi:hypothetical protein